MHIEEFGEMSLIKIFSSFDIKNKILMLLIFSCFTLFGFILGLVIFGVK
jgi:hypothetical protein